ncbi:MAG: hypothetical protein ACOYXT_10590 [Bacteroidota bacterium]
MRQLKARLLLFVLGITLFPWQLVCVAHPFGHEHHDGPSPCELRRLAAQQPGQHLMPPMDCDHILAQIDDIQQPQTENVLPAFQTVAVPCALLGQIHCPDSGEALTEFPPEPRCRSATLISDCPTRGSPLV